MCCRRRVLRLTTLEKEKYIYIYYILNMSLLLTNDYESVCVAAAAYPLRV